MIVGLSAVVVTLGVTVAITSPDRRVIQLLHSIGVLPVSVDTSLLPLNPVNTAARLAFGTAGVGARAAVTGLVFVGVAALVGLRVAVDRAGPNELG